MSTAAAQYELPTYCQSIGRARPRTLQDLEVPHGMEPSRGGHCDHDALWVVIAKVEHAWHEAWHCNSPQAMAYMGKVCKGACLMLFN